MINQGSEIGAATTDFPIAIACRLGTIATALFTRRLAHRLSALVGSFGFIAVFRRGAGRRLGFAHAISDSASDAAVITCRGESRATYLPRFSQHLSER